MRDRHFRRKHKEFHNALPKQTKGHSLKAGPSIITNSYQLFIEAPIELYVTTTLPNSTCTVGRLGVSTELQPTLNEKSYPHGAQYKPLIDQDTNRVIDKDPNVPKANWDSAQEAILALKCKSWSGDFIRDYQEFWTAADGNAEIERKISEKALELLERSLSGTFGQISLAKRLLNLVSWPAIMREVVFCRVLLALSKNFETVTALERHLGYRVKGGSKTSALRKRLSELKINREVRNDPQQSTVLVDCDLRWIEEARNHSNV